MPEFSVAPGFSFSFEILDGGKVMADDELERIWDKYALATKTWCLDDTED
jgi:hypothetical protein